MLEEVSMTQARVLQTMLYPCHVDIGAGAAVLHTARHEAHDMIDAPHQRFSTMRESAQSAEQVQKAYRGIESSASQVL
ncbi:hypothetical protein MA5S0422_2786 [Mycobacteroides abscessus 5S-0422]|uniref:Uncharacterized protein n=1 Tax=Mycobacteroides abscessus subsp. bolletii 1513 TaxID=1299321 RepID=X8DPH2_9MYCO|nr:hypothetical protein [Mycobacteroides abscessus]EIU13159.1 hypothetical protein MA5S0422_2786 [Mycobacteroides abscessus 5S-0422]EUA69380.1 hypothetical protein I540_3015 [Mycobacteroides abscessus subsp. bolletii 1513]MDO3125895.1 hypothetical protein [Mycobacteroides abscessus subsp. bolletii]